MEYKTLNKKRHAVKQFKDEKIPTVDVKQIITTACLAPSAHNIQPWHFVIVESDERREALLTEVKGQNIAQIKGAGALIALFSDTDLAQRSREIAHDMQGELPDAMLDRFSNRYPAMFEDYSAEYTSRYLSLNAGIVVMNLVFAIKDFGYESNIVQGFERTDKINDILGVAKRYRPELLIPLGKSETEGQPSPRLSQERMLEIV